MRHGKPSRSEPRKSLSIQIHREGLVRAAEHVNTQVKLLAADQQRVVDVTLHDVLLGLQRKQVQSKKDARLLLGVRLANWYLLSICRTKRVFSLSLGCVKVPHTINSLFWLCTV